MSQEIEKSRTIPKVHTVASPTGWDTDLEAQKRLPRQAVTNTASGSLIISLPITQASHNPPLNLQHTAIPPVVQNPQKKQSDQLSHTSLLSVPSRERPPEFCSPNSSAWGGGREILKSCPYSLPLFCLLHLKLDTWLLSVEDSDLPEGRGFCLQGFNKKLFFWFLFFFP